MDRRFHRLVSMLEKRYDQFFTAGEAIPFGLRLAGGPRRRAAEPRVRGVTAPPRGVT